MATGLNNDMKSPQRQYTSIYLSVNCCGAAGEGRAVASMPLLQACQRTLMGHCRKYDSGLDGSCVQSHDFL